MTNSPLIDRKIEEAYGIIRERSEKKKRQSRKRKFVQTGAAAAAIVVAIGFCAANPVLAKELPLIGNVIERVQELLGFQEIPTEEIVTLVPTGQGTYNAGEREEAGDNNTGATGIQKYGNQCGSYRTGAVSGIGSGLHHYLDGLLCHKPGNFPGGKNGERGRISGDVSE